MVKKSNIDFELSESKPKGFFQKTITLRVFILYLLIVIISMVVIIYSVLNQQINAVLLNQENKSLKTRIRDLSDQIQSEINEKSQFKLTNDSLKVIIQDLHAQIQHLEKEKSQHKLTNDTLIYEIYVLKDKNSKLESIRHQLEQQIERYKFNEKLAQKSESIDSLKSITITMNTSSSNRTEDREINGKVINADPTLYKVLVYVKTDDWYKQPFCDSRGNHEINSDGTWSTWIRPGRIYAYVVAKDYDPPCRLSMPLVIDNKRVFAKVVEK